MKSWNEYTSKQKTIALNESQRIEVERRELFIIGQNTIAAYEREQGALEANLATARRLQLKGFSIKEISEMVDVSEEIIHKELGLEKQP